MDGGRGSGQFIERVAVEIGLCSSDCREDELLPVGTDDGVFDGVAERHQCEPVADTRKIDAHGFRLAGRGGRLILRGTLRGSCFSRFGRRVLRWIGFEEVAELIFAELRQVRNEIDPRHVRLFAALGGIEQEILAVGRPGDLTGGFAIR